MQAAAEHYAEEKNLDVSGFSPVGPMKFFQLKNGENRDLSAQHPILLNNTTST